MVVFFTQACDSVSRSAATPPYFTIALMLPVLLGIVALGLGTMLYPYGGMFVGHALAAAAAFSAIFENVRATITCRPSSTYGTDVA